MDFICHSQAGLIAVPGSCEERIGLRVLSLIQEDICRVPQPPFEIGVQLHGCQALCLCLAVAARITQHAAIVRNYKGRQRIKVPCLFQLLQSFIESPHHHQIVAIAFMCVLRARIQFQSVAKVPFRAGKIPVVEEEGPGALRVGFPQIGLELERFRSGCVGRRGRLAGRYVALPQEVIAARNADIGAGEVWIKLHRLLEVLE